MDNSISIHAPTRGATACLERGDDYDDISIHAPTRGATSGQRCPLSYFLISIHAPTRGATISNVDFKSIPYISIHAPTRGATEKPTINMTINLFQSTLPREERQQYCTKNLFIFIQYRQ